MFVSHKLNSLVSVVLNVSWLNLYAPLLSTQSTDHCPNSCIDFPFGRSAGKTRRHQAGQRPQDNTLKGHLFYYRRHRLTQQGF